MWRWLWVSLLVVVLDQITKQMAAAWLNYAEPVAVAPLFNLTLLHNTGAAFSFLAQAGGWQRWFFALLALVVSVVLLIWLRRLQSHEWRTALALVLILGGAVGNLIDRVLYGYVIDFLDFYWGSYHWPAFNIADSAITVGAGVMLWDAVRTPRSGPRPVK